MNDVPRIVIKGTKWLVNLQIADNKKYCVKTGFRSFFILTGNLDIGGYPFGIKSFSL